MGVDLLAEMEAATRGVRQPHLDRMRALGVSSAIIADMGERPFGCFGVINAEPVGSGYYQPGEGAPHLVLPVVEDGALVDLVAFRSTAPDDWLLRTGNGYALGLEKGVGSWTWYAPADHDAKPPKYQLGRPAHFFANPLDWLQGGGDGLCVLDWSAAELRHFDVLPAVTVSDNATAVLLRNALSRPARVPDIQILEGLAHAA